MTTTTTATRTRRTGTGNAELVLLPGGVGTPAPGRAGTGPEPWITVNVRPTGSFGRDDVGRLRTLLDAVAACASIVVLDLRSARLRSPHAAEVIDEAGAALEARGGCLLCVGADADARARLAGCRHAVVAAPEASPSEPA